MPLQRRRRIAIERRADRRGDVGQAHVLGVEDAAAGRRNDAWQAVSGCSGSRTEGLCGTGCAGRARAWLRSVSVFASAAARASHARRRRQCSSSPDGQGNRNAKRQTDVHMHLPWSQSATPLSLEDSICLEPSIASFSPFPAAFSNRFIQPRAILPHVLWRRSPIAPSGS